MAQNHTDNQSNGLRYATSLCTDHTARICWIQAAGLRTKDGDTNRGRGNMVDDREPDVQGRHAAAKSGTGGVKSAGG